MVTEHLADALWRLYPGCHLHLDVTTAGISSYRVVVSVISEAGETVHRITYYGSGNLSKVKEDAMARLLDAIEGAPA